MFIHISVKEDSINDDKSSETGSEQTVESTKNKKSKKRVSWVADKSLAQIRYFELDETERGMVYYTLALKEIVLNKYLKSL